MSVAQLPGGEIVPAMERGVIDAYEFNNPSSDLRFGSADVAKNYYLGSYHQASEAFEFLFNRDFFDDLDPDLQAILKHGVDAASSANTYFALKNYSADLQKLQNELGVAVHKTPDEILARAARGLGHADRQPRAGRAHEADHREPARLGRAGHLLRAHERARLHARLRSLLPGQAGARDAARGGAPTRRRPLDEGARA